MSDPLKAMDELVEEFEVSLKKYAVWEEKNFITNERRLKLEEIATKQFHQKQDELFASSSQLSDHSCAAQAGPSVMVSPACVSSLVASLDTHFEDSFSTPKNNLPRVVGSRVTTSCARSDETVSGTTVPEEDSSPRPKRARRALPPYRVSPELTDAEKTLIGQFKWRRLNQYKSTGANYKYINPQGNYYVSGVKNEDLVLGEDYFFDANEALAYAQHHRE